MKIQVIEHFEGGHHSNYIKALLPDLSTLVQQKTIDDVVVTLTNQHFAMLQKQGVVAEFEPSIQFDPSLPRMSSGPSLKERRIITQNALNAIARQQPNYLISTSADFESLFYGIHHRLGLKALPKEAKSVGIFHYGYAGSTNGFSSYIKQLFYSFAWKNANWSRLLMVNPTVYEALTQNNKSARRRIGLLPDPVEPIASLDKTTARTALNLPTDGRYVGFVGAMDMHKAIPELVAAWKAANLNSSDRLLLAGKLYAPYRQLIEQDYADLLAQNRIILLDRFLSADELAAGYSALDVVAILYYRRPNLSANLLKAIATKRPAIVDNYGYTRMMVERFKVGWACDITNCAELASTLATALEKSANYTPDAATERLMQFHHPSNFSNTILQNLAGLLPSDDTRESKTWEWVCGDTSI
jgi:glycosyltransferase involved in cell wall biosynthesis